MAVSINVLMNKLYKIANQHPQLEGFGFGPLYDLSSADIQYPYMWILNDDSHTIGYGDSNKYSSVEYNFEIRIGDKVNDQPNVYSAIGSNSNNSLEVISDTFQILLDVINAVSNNSTNDFLNIGMVDDISVQPFFHEDAGNVNGHSALITLRVINDNVCISPITN
jgi:hypothetical protein